MPNTNQISQNWWSALLRDPHWWVPVIALVMVIGVFLARWSVPALARGLSQVRTDARQAPHLILWAILAGCLWAVANTLTIYAVRDIGLSIAFPLWNANGLLGILWGF